MTVPVATMIVVAALALAWIALAAAIAMVAARRFRLAETILGVARSNASLLEATPARPLLVRPDLRVDVDPQLLRDLGLKNAPVHLSGLTGNDSGLDARDLELLSAAIEGARVSAQRVAMNVRANGSGRVFEVRGGPAPAPEPPGAFLLWL